MPATSVRRRRPAPALAVLLLCTSVLLVAGPSGTRAQEGAVPAAPAHLPSGVVRPVGGEVTRPFQPPPGPYAAGHRGVDLAAEAGEEVRAALAGRVTFAGPVALVGWVTLQHDEGFSTTYGDLVPAVRVDQQVAAGQVIGHLAPAAEHLDWGVRLDGEYLDPLMLLRRWRLARAHPDDVPGGRLRPIPP